MGDGAEPVPRLDQVTLQRFQRDVMQARTRGELDGITRAIWRAHDQPANADALAHLRKAIEAKRDILKRNDPR